MPNWSEVLNQINSTRPGDNPLDRIRKKYLHLAHEYSGRNIIAYYSGFLQKPGVTNISLDDVDKNGFMQAVHKLDKNKGLDLIIHTPGGDIAATESIVDYLHKIFGNDIRAIIPQMAMSAGTMMALSCKEIIMGKQSSLGAIDPLFNGISCQGVIEEFEEAKKSIQINHATIPLWQVIVSKYHPTFIGDCARAIQWSKEMVLTWLKNCMFEHDEVKQRKAENIVNKLSDHNATKTHSRHIPINECKDLGIKVIELENIMKDTEKEDCSDFQDCILTLHHCYMHTLSISKAVKIIENHNGIAMINSIV